MGGLIVDEIRSVILLQRLRLITAVSAILPREMEQRAGLVYGRHRLGPVDVRQKGLRSPRMPRVIGSQVVDPTVPDHKMNLVSACSHCPDAPCTKIAGRHVVYRAPSSGRSAIQGRRRVSHTRAPLRLKRMQLP